MRKGLYLVLSLLVVFSMGSVLLNCGDDECKCENEAAECCKKCPKCPEGTRCDFVNEVCGDCCADAPEDEIHIWVSGITLDMTTQQPVAAAVAAISPTDALIEEDPEKLTENETGADGLYKTDCFDVKMVGLGVVMMTDDIGWENATEDNYFPTGSGAKGWEENDEKYCAEDVKSWMVPNTMVAGLDAATSVDSAGEGFVMGLVVKAPSNPDDPPTPVEGAVIKKGDGTDLTEVVYPTATGFDGTATAATGLFVLPHTNFPGGITDIVAEKTDMTFGVEQAAAKPGFCYFVYIIGQ